jgi:hypothetical protein
VKNLIPYVIAGALIMAAPAAAQQKPAAPGEVTQRATREQIPLRVQLVVSRFQGEKKISSIPYTLSVVANDDDKTSMRMGVDVPVPQTIFRKGDDPNVSTPPISYNYRSVGTNIDCSARTIEGGWFKLDLAVSDSALLLTEKGGTAAPTALVGAPAFRSFTSSFNLLLKDGQTAQHIAATDPVSGEVLKVDVTLAVLK